MLCVLSFVGGAFPEIHVAQYPLDMGRPGTKAGGPGGRASQTLALAVDAEGNIDYNAVLRRGANANKIIATGHKALVPKLEQIKGEIPKPDEEEVEKTRRETEAALQAKVQRKQAILNPKSVPTAPGAAEYIKYTPAVSSESHASGASSRIIKMQDMPVDPLEPPKFRHVKVPRGSGSPPVPVMHSPPRAMSKKEHQDWKIPPCVSNWKNAKGYTIPLDKRLAADGRGLQEVQVNDQFAKFSEALYIAEQKARTAVETRAKMQREIMAREKERKEEELRELAAKARVDRLRATAGMISNRDTEDIDTRDVKDRSSGRFEADHETNISVDRESPRDWHSSDEEREIPEAYRTRDERRRSRDRDVEETRAEREERRRRDELREERRRERERERRLEHRDAHGYKRSKLTRDKDRDVSEKIALGMAKVGTAGEAMYDQRLFNQEKGLDSGLGQEDAYNLYDKPLFADRRELYKASATDGGIDTSRFKPDQGFSGADYSRSGRETAAKGQADGIAFEMDPAEADPFGLNAFLTDGGRKKPLDGIGRRGGMAAAGGGSGTVEEYSRSGSRRRMDFVPERG